MPRRSSRTLRPSASRPLLRPLALTLLLAGCAGESLYPPRPGVLPGPPVADPPYSRAVAHVSVSREGLQGLLESSVPASAEGSFQLFGERKYAWRRGAFDLRFDNASQRLGLKTLVTGTAELPGKSVDFTLELLVEVQPVVSARYKVRLQAPVVTITTNDRLLKIAEWGGGIINTIKTTVEDTLREQSIDLAPMLTEAWQRAAQPLRLPVGDATACVDFGVKGVEMGPTLLIDGFEKDLAIVMGPSVTLPCTQAASQPAGQAASTPTLALPTLQNTSGLPTGPFTVTVPVAATYEELQRAMTQAFTGGKLFFAADFPNLYLEKPEVYANGGEVVLKLHLDGFVQKGFKIPLSGDLYLSGHPVVHDNELEFDDMRPTIETSNALLKLKTKLDEDAIKRQVKQALRLDISQRLLSVREKLRDSLTYRFEVAPGVTGCFRTDVGRIEVTNIYAHDTYLRMYVQVTAQASVQVPCELPPSEPSAPSAARD